METRPPHPAPRRAAPKTPRHDGWTLERRRTFLETLGESGSVSDACRAAGMSRESAYALRRRADAADFADAWEIALTHATQRLADLAFERAIHGVVEETIRDGEVVTERRRISDRLLIFLLTHHHPLQYGRLGGQRPFDAWVADKRSLGVRGFAAMLDGLRRSPRRKTKA